MQHIEGVVRAFSLPLGRTVAAEARDIAPAALRQDPGQAVFVGIDHHPTAGGHGTHQVMKLPLDGCQVVKNIGMVEFEVVEHGSARPVMHELAALVEESRVVLVRFDDEKGCRTSYFACCLAARCITVTCAEACRHVEIEGHATHQKPGRTTCKLKNPGQHRRCRGLAVRACNG